MYKTLTRILCIGLILTLCIPMVACDQVFNGGLLGELLNQTVDELETHSESEITQDYIESQTSVIEPDIMTEVPIETEGPIEPQPDQTVEYTTEPPTTQPPIVEPEPVKVIAAKSFDSLIKYPSEEPIVASGYDFLAWEKDAVAVVDHLTDSLLVWGWVAYYTQTEGTVGYSINHNDIVYDASFTFRAEEGVQDYVKANIPGANSACRMKFHIPTADLDVGEHNIRLIAKDSNGNEELLCEFLLIKTLPYQTGVHTAYSFDYLGLNDAPYVTEGLVMLELAAQNNTVTVPPNQEKGSITMRGWAAFESVPAVEYGYYIGDEIVIITQPSFVQARPDLAAAGFTNATGFKITAPLSNIPAGTHPVGIIAKLEDGTYAQLASFYIKILPEVEDQTILLGTVGNNTRPHNYGAKKFGQRLPLGQTFLQQITIERVATYASIENTWSLKIWQWNTDYNFTVSNTPLIVINGQNHLDNSDFTVDIPLELLISGDIYYELEYVSGDQCFTGWVATDVLTGVETYVDGVLSSDSYAASIVVGVAQ